MFTSRLMKAFAVVVAASLLISLAQVASAAVVPLQNATAQLSQGGLPVTAAIDNIYSFADAGGAGWANNALADNIAAFETVSDIDLSQDNTTLRFNLFAGGFGQHTIGKYRVSYTTDDRSTFADGLINGGDVTANWTVLHPYSAVSSDGATLTIQPDGSILASGTNPNRSNDTLMAILPPQAGAITGFRLEAIEDASFPANGPGRSGNGNFVLREFDVAAFRGRQVLLQNGTARLSQGNFSVDNMINGDFDLESASNVGWADVGGGSAGNTADNVATFETVTDIVNSGLISVDILSGGFSVHTIGRFRLSITDADRSLFADGNDNGGAGVGAEGIWRVVDIESIVSDNPGTTFTELGDKSILAGGTPAELELYTLSFHSELSKITGFRFEILEDASLPNLGPGRGGNGNLVIREFSVFAAPAPEPATASMALLGLLALARRRKRAA